MNYILIYKAYNKIKFCNKVAFGRLEVKLQGQRFNLKSPPSDLKGLLLVIFEEA